MLGTKTLGPLAVLVTAGSLAFVASASSPPRAGTPAIDRGPYLQGTTRTSVTIVWRTTAPTDSVVSFDSPDGPTRLCGDSGARTLDHVVTVTGLEPGTRYAYQVTNDGAPLGPRSSFATAPLRGAPFTALVFGDSGHDTPEQFALARRMVKERCDLVLHTGDLVYETGEAERYDPVFFAPYGELLRSTPFFPSIGNHDLGTADGQPYKDVFFFEPDNPERSKKYYSFEWGDAKFISLETYETFRKPGAPLRWLENELAQNTRRWLVVYMHVPLYSVGEHGDDPELQRNLQGLLEKYRVDLLLCGHDHIYERAGPVTKVTRDSTWPGLRYIVTGGGGAYLYRITPTHPWPTVAESAHHYTLLTFRQDEIVGREVRIDGSTGDSFSMAHY